MATSRLLQTIAKRVTAGVNPINSPAAHDVFKIRSPSGAEVFSPPGKIIECNGRESIAQEQQAPGFTGAILVIRGEHLISVTYEIVIITTGGTGPSFEALNRLLPILTAAQNARPQQSLRLTDLRLRNLRGGSFDVTPIVTPFQDLVSAGQWKYRIKFTQNARLKLAGGPVQPPRNDRERDMKAREDRIATKGKAYNDLVADQSKKAGKL